MWLCLTVNLEKDVISLMLFGMLTFWCHYFIMSFPTSKHDKQKDILLIEFCSYLNSAVMHVLNHRRWDFPLYTINSRNKKNAITYIQYTISTIVYINTLRCGS